MKKQWIYGLSIAVCVVLVAVTQARSFEEGPFLFGQIQDRVLEHLDRELGLSEEQKLAFRTRSRQGWEQNRAVMEQLKGKFHSLRDELENMDSDPRRVEGLTQDINVLRGMLLTSRINNLVDMKEILTAEQFVLLKDKIRARRAVRKEMLKKWLQAAESML